MAVGAARRTGPTALVAARTRRFEGRGERRLVVRVGWGRLSLAAKEWAFAPPPLGPQVFACGLAFGEPGAGALMQALAGTGVLTAFERCGQPRPEVAA